VRRTATLNWIVSRQRAPNCSSANTVAHRGPFRELVDMKRGSGTFRVRRADRVWQTQNKIKNFQSSRSRGGYYRPTTLSYDVIHDVFVQFTFV